jgi:hypothetical protein
MSDANGKVNFFIVSFHFLMGTVVMKAPHLYKLHKKCLTGTSHGIICSVGRSFSNCKLKMTMKKNTAFHKDAKNFHLRHLNWFPNWQLKNWGALPRPKSPSLSI